MNNIKISQLDEDLSPSLDAITVVVFDDVAKNATIQSIKETIFSTGVTVNGTLDVTDDVTLESDLTVNKNIYLNDRTKIVGDLMVTGNTSLNGDTNIVGDLMVTGDTQTIYNWTSPNDTKWSTVQCQGHNTVTINNNQGTIWFPFSGVPMSSGNGTDMSTNFLRGGVIDYFTVCNGPCNTLATGTVTFTRDGTPTTNETRTSYSCDLYFGEGNSDYGLKVWSNGNSGEMDLIIQWTAKLFYAEENFC